MIKIGELSNISGVSIQTIRYYESEGLIFPIKVDQWTNYRYYDDRSVKRLSEICYLKELGFSLNEIKHLNSNLIREKLSQVQMEIQKLTDNINKLSSVNSKGEFYMKNFVNDERVVGKWQKIGVVKNKEDFKLNKFDANEIFDFDFENLFFLPNGKDYWVFSWTKGILYFKAYEFPYEIIDEIMFLGIVDYKTNEVYKYAVFKKIDSKHYDAEEIRFKDNTNIEFETDKKVIGFWDAIDFVQNPSKFTPNENLDKELSVKRYTFEPDGTLLISYNDSIEVKQKNWSKNFVINKALSIVSKYTIKTIDNIDYMFVEWKTGPYAYTGKFYAYYVFKKIK